MKTELNKIFMMRRILIVSISFFICINVLAEEKLVKRYPFKSGMVKYKHSGKNRGTTILYFDDYGRKEARFENTEVTIMGFTQKSNKVNIIDGKYQYEYDLQSNSGVKMQSPLILTTQGGDDYEDWEEFSVGLMKGLGFEKLGTEKVLGYDCDVWSGMGKSWMWKGINLKTEVNMMGQFIIEAIEVKTNVSIPQSKFKVPNHIRFEEDNSSYYDEELGASGVIKEPNQDVQKHDNTNSEEDMKKSIEILKSLLSK